MNISPIAAVAVAVLLFNNPTEAYMDALDGLLKDHVKPVTESDISYNGVDYDSWKEDPRHAIVRDKILSTDLALLDTKNRKLAYWINAYNVLTIDLIIREDERESIKNLGNIFKSPWKKYTWSFAEKDYTLDEIEHKIIRKFKEPKVHFAINCAAISCPDLRIESYRPQILDSQLEDQTISTFKNRKKGYAKIKGKNKIRVTKVMKWYDEDFKNGDLASWLKPYFPDKINDKTSVRFLKYNWDLNKQ